ncbi:MAG TPA: PQQ-binding-like beta-propeller repeat protein, partial [Burkholderiaceae bacterium]|nr:PQQ-binding-like beta-propeller repeat protein [Burkholderiaceae bacterium]
MSKLVATLAGLLGLSMSVLGGWLVLLGGNVYYLIAGLGLLAACWFAWRSRPVPALFAMGFVVGLTLLWSLWELHGKGWMPAWPIDLAARVGLPALLFALMAFAWGMGRPLADAEAMRRSRRTTTLASLVVLVLAAGLVTAGWERPSASVTDLSSTTDRRDTDWLAFGGTPAGERYLDAAQITPANVHRLREAWRFHSGDSSPDPERVFYSAQNTPIKADGLLYVCTPSNRVHALDAGTGEPRWQHDPAVPARSMESAFSAACRAVGYHADDTAPADASCARRVFVSTADGRLLALDALEGNACEGFGEAGVVDLTFGMGLSESGHASNNSGPSVIGGLVVVGQQVSDNQRRDAPSGVVRAYDASSGALRWAWDAKRIDRPQQPLAPGETWPQGTPNVWNVISGDEALGLVLLGTGNAGNDHYGGDRDAEDDEYSSAVVAVDLATGATRWHFRTVIDDRFDYDVGAQPVLTGKATVKRLDFGVGGGGWADTKTIP